MPSTSNSTRCDQSSTSTEDAEATASGGNRESVHRNEPFASFTSCGTSNSESYSHDSSRGSRKRSPSPTSQSGKSGTNMSGCSAEYPSSQGSCQATPPKTKLPRYSDIPSHYPSDLECFLSNAVYSNKTQAAFLIYSTPEKCATLYLKLDEKFKPEFKSKHVSDDGSVFLFVLTPSKHRVSAVKNYCAKHCTISFLLCKGIVKIWDCYTVLCNPPYKMVESNRPSLTKASFEEMEQQGVDWNLITEYACQNRLTDPYVILGLYLDFATPIQCTKCAAKTNKLHYKYHSAHHENALLFLQCKNQKNICQQAADVVIAKRRVQLLESTRASLLEERFQIMLERMKELEPIDIWMHMAGVAWYSTMFMNIDQIVMKILKLLTENIPKKRNILFRGPINSGKTSLAAAIVDLVGGKPLNVNCPAEKLPFELGCAIDQFSVIFEDVKGPIALNKSLQPGIGVSNLDNMRDYLDGSVNVNLEKKHVNKKAQIFPPCIVTMNEYLLPQTLAARFAYTLPFQVKDCLRISLEKNDVLAQKRIMQSGLTIFMLLLWYCPTSAFATGIQEQVVTEKEVLEKYVSNTQFADMMVNIVECKDPLDGIVIDVDDDDMTESEQSTQQY